MLVNSGCLLSPALCCIMWSRDVPILHPSHSLCKGVGFRSPVLKMEGYFWSNILTSAGTETGLGCNYVGSKAGEIGGGGGFIDVLVTLTTKIGWFHLRNSIWQYRDRWSSAGWQQKRWRNRTVKTGQIRFGGGRSQCSASKKYLASLWGNSDFELSEDVYAQNGACHSGSQKLWRKKFAVKLDSFLNKSPKGDWLSICPLEQGARWIGFGSAGNNTHCCPSVNQIPVMSQLISEKNDSSIWWKMHAAALACA
jgi:hypothetical protein